MIGSTRRSLRAPLFALATLLLGAPAATHASQTRPTCTVVRGARVWLPDGPTKGAPVAFDHKGITSVGEGTPTGPTCLDVDGAGHVLTAGFIDPFTTLGLVEIELEPSAVDHAGDPLEGAAIVRASFPVWEGYNPRSTIVPITRIAGVTSAIIAPTGGLVSGLGAWVDLTGASQAEAVARPRASLHATLGQSDKSRARRLHILDQLLSEARDFERLRAVWERTRQARFAFEPAELDAMLLALRGSVPLVLRANRASDIEAILRLAERHRLPRVIIAGGGEAWLHAEALAAAKIAVIVDPILNAPESFDLLEVRADNAARLRRAGVDVMISTFHGHNVRLLRQSAGNAVREGLEHAAAIEALTGTPARVYGMPDRGRVAAGARADLVLWSGDPLELSSRVVRLWIGGREIALESRQRRLRDRYRSLPGTPSEPLPLVPLLGSQTRDR